MKDGRSTLPPLDGLVFFEVAARQLSFTAAAKELYVSQTAVSKRIRQLEVFLSVTLFVRDGRSLTLTEEGEELYGKVSITLDFLRRSLQQISDKKSHIVNIAASNAISMFWLQDQLKKFGLTASACPVNLMTSDETRHLTAGENDLVVLPWACPLPGYECTELFTEQLVPVASPKLAATFEDDHRLGFLRSRSGEKQMLLSYRREEPFWENWEGWSETMEIEEIKSWPSMKCITYAHTIGKAIEGEGIALGSVKLLHEELSSGVLQQVSTLTMKSANSYYLARHANSHGKHQVDELHQYLTIAASNMESV